jgi:uncharacterized protein YecT (DUF1311 family)
MGQKGGTHSPVQRSGEALAMKRILAAAVAVFVSTAHAEDFIGHAGNIAARALENYSGLVKSCREGSDVACLKRAYAEAEKQLNAAYSERIGRYPPARRERLRAAQHTWVSWRNQNCQFWRGSDPIGEPIYLDCMIWATIERTEELQSRLED